MCNPRRIQVTATRQINEAWEREVTRAVQLQGLVSGQARVLQQLGPTVGVPALDALQRLLDEGSPDWRPTEAGYRHVVYDPRQRTLEIVAQCEDLVTTTGAHTELLTGLVQAEASQTGEGVYYDDWAARTREMGEKQAQDDAQRKLDNQQRQLVREAAQQAEDEAAAGVESSALRETARRHARVQAERREQLAADARANLRQVGVRARQAFHQLLARAYQQAILAYARAHGAAITCNDDQGETIEIEFRLPQ
jgi:hypothetical protein